jgi:hypothetical protein
VAVDREPNFGKFGAHLREVGRLNPGRRDDDVRDGSGRAEPVSELGSTDNGPDIRLNALGAHTLSSVERRYSESDMAHRAVGGEVFVSEYDLQLCRLTGQSFLILQGL